MASKYSTGFYVYVHRKNSDGQIFYVGKGMGNRALSRHGRNNYWHNVVNKHGYTVEIVLNGMEEPIAFELECELIAFYGRENLCNLTSGGDGASGSVKSLEARQKIAKSKIGIARHDMRGENSIMRRKGVSEKVSASRKLLDYSWMHGNRNPSSNPDNALKISNALKGKAKSATHRKNLSKANLGKSRPHIAGDKNPAAKAVLCVTTGQHFGTMKEAVQWLKSIGYENASDAPISRCCKGVYKYGYKMQWEFA